jgi:hypothetical protein
MWIVLVTLLSLPAFANDGGHGNVAGRVLDQTGRPLAGVSVELVSADTTLTTTSALDGTFRFEHVRPGAAELTLRLVNFTLLRRVTVSAARVSWVGDLAMMLSITADVVVTAPATFRNLADIDHPEQSLVGVASSASEGAITAAQIETHPIARAGEVLETVPGMIVSQHSGEGKANQSYVRGFNLDHGTDFVTVVGGVPVNMPTGAHAHATPISAFQRSIGQAHVRATAFVLHNYVNLFSNFTCVATSISTRSRRTIGSTPAAAPTVW